MRFHFKVFGCATICSLLLISCAPSSKGPYQSNISSNVLVVEAYESDIAQGTRTLVVYVHGAVSKGGPADYMYRHARDITIGRNGVVGAAILRPGYYDKKNRKSPGSNYGRRDSTSPQNNQAVASTIRRLRQKYGAKKVIAVGHSAGALAIGAIIGRTKGLVDVAVLVSCPCNIAEWRGRHGWRPYSRSESPHSVVTTIPKNVKVYALTGAQDNNTYPAIAQRYVAQLKERGIRAKFISVPLTGHRYGGRLSVDVDSVVGSEL